MPPPRPPQPNYHALINQINNQSYSSQAPGDSSANRSLFYDDFSNGYAPNTNNSPYFLFPGANDAAGGITVQQNNLTIRSSPYTLTSPTFLNILNYVALSKASYVAPNKGELVFETIMSLQQTGLNNLPAYLKASNGNVTGVNNANEDMRLSHGGLYIIDLATQMMCGFTVTNEDINAAYIILPLNKPQFGGAGPDYDAFVENVTIMKRNVANPLGDYVKLSIGYNYAENYIRWSVNDIEKYRINRLGYPIDRKYRINDFNTPGQLASPSKILRPTGFNLLFGTGNAMGAFNPQNPGNVSNAALVDVTSGSIPSSNPNVTNVNGTCLAASFLAPYNAIGMVGTNFGQGCDISVNYLSVYTLTQPGPFIFSNGNSNSNNIALSPEDQNEINGVNSTEFVYD
jgi:hypothetical protein